MRQLSRKTALLTAIEDKSFPINRLLRHVQRSPSKQGLLEFVPVAVRYRDDDLRVSGRGPAAGHAACVIGRHVRWRP
jgi:hypothetical protein